MKNMDKGLTVVQYQSGADKLAENAPRFIFQNCLPKPKSLGIQWPKGYIGRP